MVNRRKQQLGGLFIALLGAGLTGWNWYTALSEGYFYPKLSILFPAFFVIGGALILFPDYKEERIARGEDISGMQGWRLITRRWWVVTIMALVIGIANYLLMLFQ